MSHVAENLLPTEKIQYSGKLHPIVFAKGVFIAVVGLMFLRHKGFQFVGMCLIVVAALFLFATHLVYTTSEFVVTNRRIVMKFGWLRRSSLELFQNRIESISVDQGIVGRIVNCGQIKVRGIGGTSEEFYNLAAPQEFRRQIQLVTQLG
jgi:uncharacterized membrane protein YdbT with pleckstrin-like domain